VASELCKQSSRGDRSSRPGGNYERVLANLQRYVREHAISYPVAVDMTLPFGSLWQSLLARYVSNRQARSHSLLA
jgi:hypothetical protein